ncbi:dienelactone hydrolase family protein [Spirosoma aerolatum]|uniref:dienelactone hydrolase family protein n=1 Tax=Spirosoma aerolatum TaxID=1211326 RepID=UPI0009AC63BA|nr:dienelactone hydrolase family protein [Spirosoma aerolatum]
MKRWLFFFSFWSIGQTYAQTTRLDDLCQVFHLPDGKDTTTFIVFGTKEDLKVRKPLFLFRQGSQPMPLIVQDSGKYYIIASPFHFRPYKNSYHFVMVQKPGVRLVATQQFLDNYQKAMHTGNATPEFISQKYIENNYRERYVAQCNQVINYLVKQPWVDTRKVVFCGGSEGFTVGADLVANYNRYITHTILFSGHAGRRFENPIYSTRQQIEKGEISAEEGQKQIESLYAWWADIQKHPTALTNSPGDTYRAWKSFSIRNLDNLLRINTPLYIAYGTADKEIAPGLDYLPLEFIEHGKANLTLKAYHDHDHQFFKLKRDSTRQIIDKEYNGEAVAKEWMEWLDQNPIKTSLK